MANKKTNFEKQFPVTSRFWKKMKKFFIGLGFTALTVSCFGVLAYATGPNDTERLDMARGAAEQIMKTKSEDAVTKRVDCAADIAKLGDEWQAARDALTELNIKRWGNVEGDFQ